MKKPLILLNFLVAVSLHAVNITGEQTAPTEWTYTLTFAPFDNYSLSQQYTTITIDGLFGVTNATGPTSTDFPYPELDQNNTNWTAEVLNGGTSVRWTHDGPGTGNFTTEKHVYGFKVFANGAVNGVAFLATSGFAGEDPYYGVYDLDFTGPVYGPVPRNPLTIRYVNANNAHPRAPYDNFPNAARTIQDALDVSVAHDLILVTNGIYHTGGRAVYGSLTNRVAVTNAIEVRSINGPEVTVVQGYQVPGTTNGDSAIRCVYLANGAILNGFTLTNGATRQWDYDYSQVSGGGVWCQSMYDFVTNCILTGNSASSYGGGAFHGTLNNCMLTDNRADTGGGACSSFIKHCTLSANFAGSGGGASYATLENCMLADNSAYSGGGANGSLLINCTLTGNSAFNTGGGTLYSDLNSCALSGNSANDAGAAHYSRLTNCTITGNSAKYSAGGTLECDLFNSVVYYNTAVLGAANYANSALDFCCTTPPPPNGSGNITDEPKMASASHLSSVSPCRGAGSPAYVFGTDIDGEPWLKPPSIGCDEYREGSVIGPLSVAASADYTNVATGFTVAFQGSIAGQVSTSEWDFGDGTVVSNLPCVSHAWTAEGIYPVVLRAYNESNPGGISAMVVVQVVARPVHYVCLDSPSPAPPYTSWATAATSIQDAVDTASVIGALVLVSNGVYQTGATVLDGRLSNRVAVTKMIEVRSLNGPDSTIIQGYQMPGVTNGPDAIRCVYLADRAVLNGFTLANGATCKWTDGEWKPDYQSGGGVWCESNGAVVTNCILIGNSAAGFGGGAYSGTLKRCVVRGNSASNGGGAYLASLEQSSLGGNAAWSGGGAYQSVLRNCTLTGNSSSGDGGGVNGGTLYNSFLTSNSANDGGGAYEATLNNCTVIANSAGNDGGGAFGSDLNNCIVYYNSAMKRGPNYAGGTLNHCCTTPMPEFGSGSITNDPALASLSHLSSLSPCHGGGSPAYATGSDIDGEPWLTPPSIGCDEYREGSVTGLLSVAVSADYFNAVPRFAVTLQGLISGRLSGSVWDFADGVVVSNQPVVSHAWATVGDYPVVLRVFNESNPGGISATVTVHVVTQPVHYVRLESVSPSSPYTSWETAANNIQDAVDAASTGGALILVSNGVYRTGARTYSGILSNRVVVNKPVEVRSVNGPEVTIIQGYQVPETSTGETAIRCVHLASVAVLNGFTLTNGATAGWSGYDGNGAGVWCESTNALVTNCVLVGNSAGDPAGSWGGSGGGAYSGTLTHCKLAANSAYSGGGASSSTLGNCTLIGNLGGGAVSCNLSKCTLSGNSSAWGGGASDCTLDQCTLSGNSANQGGGAYYSTLNNCILTRNSATNVGGGAYNCTLNNCALTGNSAYSGSQQYTYGGGAYGGTLNNCTLTRNSALVGGGANAAVLNNCIVYYNCAKVSAPNYSLGDYSEGILNFCCTTPMPSRGTGNITNEPVLAGAWNLSSLSPCRGAGSAAYATGTDMDGEQWLNPPSIGCDEFQEGAITGPLSVEISASYTNVAEGFTVTFQAFITGPVSESTWDFGDGVVVTNQPFASHAWATAGDYPVVLTAWNDSYPDGVSATLIVHVVNQPIHYVRLASAAPATPYSSWATAARNIQDAIDVASVPGALVLVNNGVYETGSIVLQDLGTNRVVVDKPLVVRSLNGPELTVIKGYRQPGSTYYGDGVRCAYIANGAVLSGFTLTNGANASQGGGVLCESDTAVVTNCILTGNSAGNDGGGARYGTLNKCILAGNLSWRGGGAAQATLNDCILTNNSAYIGGAAFYGTFSYCTLEGNSSSGYGGATCGSVLNNCIVARNRADGAGGGAYWGTLNHCTLQGNSTDSEGGGAHTAVLNNCYLTGNSASFGGGAANSTLNNCTMVSNSAHSGGGASGGVLNNCALAFNSADLGGGASDMSLQGWSIVLNNCTLTGNSASERGGGAFNAFLRNCILYDNTAAVDGANYLGGTLNYCCTTPMPASGLGNITNAPILADISHLSSLSLCRGAGNPAYATGFDIDGETWLNPPSIGCDEYREGSVAGPLSVEIVADWTNVMPGFVVSFQAFINGRVSASLWDFADGVSASNQPFITHAWDTPGDYPVVLRAYNESNPGGISATVLVQVVTRPVHYVRLQSANPAPPYTSWATAAPNIQDAVDAAIVPGALVLVSNGVYQTGGRVVSNGEIRAGGTNRVVVAKMLEVRSLNGPGVTTIRGYYQLPLSYTDNTPIRCAYLGNGAVLSGFTITGGASPGIGYGGGLWCESSSVVVSNCIISSNGTFYSGGGACRGTFNDCVFSGNSAYHEDGGGAWAAVLNRCVLRGNDGYWGGGAYASTLNNCLLIGNSARVGGGVGSSGLNNCTLADNSAEYNGGGAYGSTLNNCIVYYNTGGGAELANYRDCTFNSCCTTPMPASGIGNISADPIFVKLSQGDFHLQSDSPCINAGLNTFVTDLVDLDGNPRIRGGTVDMGSYEALSVPSMAPAFAGLAPVGADAMNLVLSGDSGALEIHTSSNLTTWSWLATVTNLTGQVFYADPAGTQEPRRFYRAIQLP